MYNLGSVGKTSGRLTLSGSEKQYELPSLPAVILCSVAAIVFPCSVYFVALGRNPLGDFLVKHIGVVPAWVSLQVGMVAIELAAYMLLRRSDRTLALGYGIVAGFASILSISFFWFAVCYLLQPPN